MKTPQGWDEPYSPPAPPRQQHLCMRWDLRKELSRARKQTGETQLPIVGNPHLRMSIPCTGHPSAQP